MPMEVIAARRESARGAGEGFRRREAQRIAAARVAAHAEADRPLRLLSRLLVDRFDGSVTIRLEGAHS